MAWAFAEHPDSEIWRGPYEVKEVAIAEALAHFGAPDDGCKPCISECRPVTPEDEIGDESWTFLCVGPVELIDFGDRDAGTNPS